MTIRNCLHELCQFPLDMTSISPQFERVIVLPESIVSVRFESLSLGHQE